MSEKIIYIRTSVFLTVFLLRDLNSKKTADRIQTFGRRRSKQVLLKTKFKFKLARAKLYICTWLDTTDCFNPPPPPCQSSMLSMSKIFAQELVLHKNKIIYINRRVAEHHTRGLASREHTAHTTGQFDISQLIITSFSWLYRTSHLENCPSQCWRVSPCDNMTCSDCLVTQQPEGVCGASGIHIKLCRLTSGS